MRRRSPRTSFAGRLSILFLLVSTILQMTLLAMPAAADMPPTSECTEDGLISAPEYFPGATVWYVCHVSGTMRWWGIYLIEDTPYHSKRTGFSDSSPCWKGEVVSAVAKGFYNGFGLGAFTIKDCNDNPISRPIMVQLIIKNNTTGGTCVDTGWQQASSSRSVFTVERARDLPGTCGGSGYYESRARGALFSTTTNSWITTSWVLSQQINLVNCCAPETKPPPELDRDARSDHDVGTGTRPLGSSDQRRSDRQEILTAAVASR
jgi:hypothetical protein